jgi:DNA-binding NarL/FixJ family response regulator
MAPRIGGKGALDLIRLGIVDDHPAFRLGLRAIFDRQRDLKVIWDLGSAARLLATVDASPVDVVLMDLDLGSGEDGLVATRALTRAHPEIRVAIITASLDSASKTASTAVGASGYLLKDLPVAELVSAVRKISTARPHRRGVQAHPRTTPAASNRPWSASRGLSNREQEVLTALSRGDTNREIARQLGVSITTVNKHVQMVLKKLHVKTRGQAVARLHAESTAHGAGEAEQDRPGSTR